MRLDIRKWGNSKAIRLPKKLLKEWDREPVAFDAEVKGQRGILPSIVTEQPALDVVCKDYAGNKDDYPFEIVDKG
ncbi:MAG: AbrB/MazE/SpoVT family DNA-binding domain-containing protein [Ligilactobacillus sp.]|nr:AbrB/MazE/SpoVT family DNA-binding domain-containing protein [Ligilactobacillus sp.]